MLTFIYPVLSAILAAFIEWIRIDRKHGNVTNIGKFVTVNIAVILFIFCLALSVNYYDSIGLGHVLCYALYYTGCRGLFYDPLLNLFRGLPLSYFSTYTNSRFDKLSANLGGFWASRCISLFTSLIFGYLWQLLRSNTI